MLAYDINDILQIIPEAEGLVKQASMNEDFPIDSADSTLASALRIEYLTKVAGEKVQYSIQESTYKAVEAFGLLERMNGYADRMTKYASAVEQANHYDKKASLSLSAEAFDGNFGYGQDLTKQASYASSLVGRYMGMDIPENVLRYASVLPLGESQLFNALEKRAFETKDERYSQILDVISDFTVDSLNEAGREKRASVAASINAIDQEIHYNGDIYREAFIKEASVQIKLKTKSVPFESIDRLGKGHIGDILGKDVADALTGDAANDKAVIEALPIDEKAALERFV